MHEALRIGFAVAFAAAIMVSMTSPKPARAEDDQATSFNDRWATTEPPPLGCGFVPSADIKEEPFEDYETIERKQRARIKAILALPSREG